MKSALLTVADSIDRLLDASAEIEYLDTDAALDTLIAARDAIRSSHSVLERTKDGWTIVAQKAYSAEDSPEMYVVLGVRRAKVSPTTWDWVTWIYDADVEGFEWGHYGSGDTREAALEQGLIDFSHRPHGEM